MLQNESAAKPNEINVNVAGSRLLSIVLREEVHHKPRGETRSNIFSGLKD